MFRDFRTGVRQLNILRLNKRRPFLVLRVCHLQLKSVIMAVIPLHSHIPWKSETFELSVRLIRRWELRRPTEDIPSTEDIP